MEAEDREKGRRRSSKDDLVLMSRREDLVLVSGMVRAAATTDTVTHWPLPSNPAHFSQPSYR